VLTTGEVIASEAENAGGKPFQVAGGKPFTSSVYDN
jgi:hypothetical protein